MIKVFSDAFYCEVRDWLLVCFIVVNSGRSGVVVNLKIIEFKEVVFYFGNEEDLVRYRVFVSDYKTVVVYGVVVVWIYDDLYYFIDMFLRILRNVVSILVLYVE